MQDMSFIERHRMHKEYIRKFSDNLEELFNWYVVLTHEQLKNIGIYLHAYTSTSAKHLQVITWESEVIILDRVTDISDGSIVYTARLPVVRPEQARRR